MRTRYTRKALLATIGLLAAGAAPAAAAPTPDVGKAIGYLTAPATLIDGTHYTYSYSGTTYTDYGTTINAAFGLAAAGTENPALQKIVDFMNANGSHYAGPTADYGPSAGASGKLAVLAEVAGENPRSFAGQDLIAELDGYVCTTTTSDCAAPGAYSDVYSTLSQAFGVIAQLRAGDSTNAATPVSYLESLQASDGSFPSQIPSTGDKDTDSTAMAAIALSLASGGTASTDLAKAESYLVSQQQADGGFHGASGDSVNSTALALLALELQSGSYQTQITKGLAFLAAQQNADGGFNVAIGTPGSDLLASSQALSGTLLTPFSTLSDPYGGPAPTVTVTGGPATGTTYAPGAVIPPLQFSCAPAVGGTLATGLNGCSARVDGGTPQASGITLPAGTGAHTVSVTATDTDDRYTAQTITYSVAAPAVTTVTTSSTTTRAAPAPTPVPALTHVTQTHTRWRTSSRAAVVSRASTPVGTTFAFELNERAVVTLRFTRRLPGRKVGHLCDTPTRFNRRHPRCTITLTATLTVHGGKPGRNVVRFYGQLSRHHGLGAGSYSVAISATAGGHTSKAQQLRFTIV